MDTHLKPFSTFLKIKEMHFQNILRGHHLPIRLAKNKSLATNSVGKRETNILRIENKKAKWYNLCAAQTQKNKTHSIYLIEREFNQVLNLKDKKSTLQYTRCSNYRK